MMTLPHVRGGGGGAYSLGAVSHNCVSFRLDGALLIAGQVIVSL